MKIPLIPAVCKVLWDTFTPRRAPLWWDSEEDDENDHFPPTGVAVNYCGACGQLIDTLA